MGTRGYTIYRYKGWYFIYYSNNDSYPSVVGVYHLAQIPDGSCPEEEYIAWLAARRAKFQALLDRPESEQERDDPLRFYMDKSPPKNDLFNEWIYEIDLDHQVFLVDNQPLFTLRPRPASLRVFCKSISFNSYGHRGYARTTPQRNIYHWKAVAPVIPDEAISSYNVVDGLTINELLGIPLAIPDYEFARITLYEYMVGGNMQPLQFGYHFTRLEMVSDPADISPYMKLWGEQILRVGFSRMLFGLEGKRTGKVVLGPATRPELIPLAPRVCMKFATHLDDEKNRKKHTVEFIVAISDYQKTSGAVNKEAVYGVLFSFFHCVIVQVLQTGAVRATSALPFLPHLYTKSPSTPGIAAIARLVHFEVISKLPVIGPALDEGHFLNKIPLDVLQRLAEELPPLDLENLRRASAVFHVAATSVLKYPHVGQFRLENAKHLAPAPPDPISDDEDDVNAGEGGYYDYDDDDQEGYNSGKPLYRLRAGNFEAAVGTERGETLVVAGGRGIDPAMLSSWRISAGDDKKTPVAEALLFLKITEGGQKRDWSVKVGYCDVLAE